MTSTFLEILWCWFVLLFLYGSYTSELEYNIMLYRIIGSDTHSVWRIKDVILLCVSHFVHASFFSELLWISTGILSTWWIVVNTIISAVLVCYIVKHCVKIVGDVLMYHTMWQWGNTVNISNLLMFCSIVQYDWGSVFIVYIGTWDECYLFIDFTVS